MWCDDHRRMCGENNLPAYRQNNDLIMCPLFFQKGTVGSLSKVWLWSTSEGMLSLWDRLRRRPFGVSHPGLVGIELRSWSSWVKGGGNLRSTIQFSLKGDIVNATNCGCQSYRVMTTPWLRWPSIIEHAVVSFYLIDILTSESTADEYTKANTVFGVQSECWQISYWSTEDSWTWPCFTQMTAMSKLISPTHFGPLYLPLIISSVGADISRKSADRVLIGPFRWSYLSRTQPPP